VSKNPQLPEKSVHPNTLILATYPNISEIQSDTGL